MKVILKNNYTFNVDTVIESAQPNFDVDGNTLNIVYYLAIQESNVVNMNDVAQNMIQENIENIRVISDNDIEITHIGFVDIISIQASMSGNNYFLDIRLRKPPEALVSVYFKNEYLKLKEVTDNV